MSAAPVETLKEIFHSARELQGAERTAFLDRACGADKQLRREVEQLLESDRQARGFIADPPAQLAAELFGTTQNCSDAGRVVGQYRLIECIGSGGMGAVYLAERADQQFEMQVAVKLIKRGMDTDMVLRRFQHERQILASLEHPNIARLLDGGTTEDGLPYFVMEYIKGERIDRYAEAHQLPITERLELFRQVCGAVSYAHQHLVVHRDLKPSNVLVTADGTPKLLDFGIAKIIEPNEGGESLATITLAGAMTPEYASPEQIEGAPATTLSDVYSLGAVLYELLTTRPPHQLPNRTPQAVAKAIETGLIDKPSVVVKRADDARRLRGDLDNIVLMAMRKDSARRYRSVEQFSEDIRRHLEGRPVTARRDTLSYRAGKFLQRNKLGVAAAALLVVTLIGGIVATAWQAHKARLHEQRARFEQARAERRFNEVRSLAHSVLFDYHDAIRGLPGSTKVREQLVKDALGYLDRLAAEAHDDPALQRELAAGYERIGDVRGGSRSASLGDTKGAADSYSKALQIREALVARNPTDAQARHDLATSQSDLGLCLARGNAPGGIEHLKAAQALLLGLTRQEPGNAVFRNDLVTTSVGLGDALRDGGDVTGAIEHYRLATATAEALVQSKPADQKSLTLQLMVQLRLSQTLAAQPGNEAAAQAANQKALAVAQALIATDPVNTDYQQGLIAVYFGGAELYKATDPATAIDYLRKVTEVEEKLVQADPANATAARFLTEAYIELAHFLRHQRDLSQALVYYNKAAERAGKVPGDAAHPDPRLTLKEITARAGAAEIRAQSGQTDFAVGECGRLSEKLREVPDDPTNSRLGLYRAEAYEYVGYAYRSIATAAATSAPQSKQYATAARDMFRACMNIFDGLRNRGALEAAEATEAKAVTAALAECDGILVK